MKQLLTKFFKDKTYRIINVSMIQNSFYFTVNIFYSTKTNMFLFLYFLNSDVRVVEKDLPSLCPSLSGFLQPPFPL